MQKEVREVHGLGHDCTKHSTDHDSHQLLRRKPLPRQLHDVMVETLTHRNTIKGIIFACSPVFNIEFHITRW